LQNRLLRPQAYKKILVAYDGSASAKNALIQAIKIAEAEGSWLKILSVAPTYEGDLDITGVRDIKEALRGPAKKFISEAKAIAEKSGAPTVITNIEEGDPSEKIVSAAEEENCDLIVMGRRGLGRLERVLVGSVTARVIGFSKKDIIVVPQDSKIGYNDLIIATDGSASSNLVTERAIRFAKKYNSTLHVISVVDVTDEFLAEAPEILEKLILNSKKIVDNTLKNIQSYDIKADGIVKEGETYRSIINLAIEKGSGMIFMGSRGRTGLKKLLLGSVAEKVIGHAPCPVFVAKSPE